MGVEARIKGDNIGKKGVMYRRVEVKIEHIQECREGIRKGREAGRERREECGE